MCLYINIICIDQRVFPAYGTGHQEARNTFTACTLSLYIRGIELSPRAPFSVRKKTLLYVTTLDLLLPRYPFTSALLIFHVHRFFFILSIRQDHRKMFPPTCSVSVPSVLVSPILL